MIDWRGSAPSFVSGRMTKSERMYRSPCFETTAIATVVASAVWWQSVSHVVSELLMVAALRDEDMDAEQALLVGPDVDPAPASRIR